LKPLLEIHEVRLRGLFHFEEGRARELREAVRAPCLGHMGPAALITPRIRVPLYQGLNEQATRNGCELIAVGGIEDHVHVLLKFPATVTVADVVKG
jgi:Transposase IS200 like